MTAYFTGKWGRYDPEAAATQITHVDGDTLLADEMTWEFDHTNFGASALQTWDLPAATVGLLIGIVRLADHNIRVQPYPGEQFRDGAADEYLEVLAGTVVLKCLEAGVWDVVTDVTGSWRIENGYSPLSDYLGYAVAEEWGSIRDNTADDTASIQAAISSGNGPCVLRSGTYKITAPLVVLGDQGLIGSGDGCILNASNVSGSVVKLGNGGVIGDNQRISVGGFRITGTATRALEIDNVQRFKLRDVLIGGSYGGATLTDGLRARKAWDGEIANISTNGSTISNAHFLFGEAFNAMQVSNLYTGGQLPSTSNVSFKFDSTDNSGTLSSGGNSFHNLTAQGTGYGVWARNFDGGVINGLYVEEVVRPIVFGDYANSKFAKNCTINGVTIYPITSAHAAGYANRKYVANFDCAIGCSINGINLEGMAGIYDVAPLTITHGAGAGAIAVARVTAAGVISSVEVLYGGAGYNSDPVTCTAGGAGSGATFTVTRSGTTVGSIAVSAGGTGYVPTNLYPAAIGYRYAVRCVVRNPSFYCGTTFSGHEWLSPLYPLLVRSASGIDYAGVAIEQDYSFKQAGPNYDGVDATVRKATTSNIHVILEHDSAGALVSNLYTPPVF